MSKTLLVIIALAFILVVSLIGVFVLRLKSRRNLPIKFREKWLEIQRLCASKETWVLAVINADKLLDNALKKKRFKGKSMGERMVAAQRLLTDNDAVWYAHNLAKKLIAESSGQLREAQVKKALVGIRQAMRDLRILNDK